MDIKTILEKYDKENITIAVLGSHSALDVCRGAKDLGFKTLVITQKGRGTPYSKYYRTQDHLGCVDEVIELDNFKDILKPEIQNDLRKRNAIFIPHRSFEVYINDYDAIENEFKVPMFGNRKLLRSEERGSGNGVDQYKIMDEAGIRYPKRFEKPEDIDGLVIVKVLEKERGFERAFFLVNSYVDYLKAAKYYINKKTFTKEALENAVIEEFIVGVQVNFNFFYDSINKRLELLGTDTRRQTNLEGFTKLPSRDQSYVHQTLGVKFEEAGHIAVTVLESLLEPAFELGEKFVAATKKLHLGGVTGPFGLQTMIIPGPPKKEIIVFDVSPRMPGSPGISATPYSGYLYGESVSAGKRVAMEIKEAIKQNKLEEVST
jgi:5-formaminoimidazole-4-carboxamide-1-(beta)-D-ribofuranosyl 5'-monophosphate synthetase